jgi:hypothetical protein
MAIHMIQDSTDFILPCMDAPFVANLLDKIANTMGSAKMTKVNRTKSPMEQRKPVNSGTNTF